MPKPIYPVQAEAVEEVIHDTAGILFKQREDVAALAPLVNDLLAPEETT